MKKLLGILVLGLLWCGVGFANELSGLYKGQTITENSTRPLTIELETDNNELKEKLNNLIKKIKKIKKEIDKNNKFDLNKIEKLIELGYLLTKNKKLKTTTFHNQCSFYVKINDNFVHVMMFNNGRLKLASCKNIEMANIVCERFINTINLN